MPQWPPVSTSVPGSLAFQRGKFPVRLVETSGAERLAIALPLQCSIHPQATLAVEKLLSLLAMRTLVGMEPNEVQVGQLR